MYSRQRRRGDPGGVRGDLGAGFYCFCKIYKVPAGATEPVPADAELIAQKTVPIAYSGYHTIKLDTPAAIGAGEKFSVVQVIKGGDNQWYTPVEISSNNSSQTAVCNRGKVTGLKVACLRIWRITVARA